MDTGPDEFIEEEDEEEEEEKDGKRRPPSKESKAPKKFRKRFRYGVRTKLKAVQEVNRLMEEMLTLEKHCKVGGGLKVKVLEMVSGKTGIPSSTIEDWTLSRNSRKIEDEVNRILRDRRAREMKVIVSPKLCRPWFPLSEQKLKQEIVALRSKHMRYSFEKAQRRLKEEALKENKERAEKCKFSRKMVERFLKRNGLSSRKPSCVKAKSLEVAIKEVRGFLRWFREDLLLDKEKKSKNELDALYGRFPLAWRVNKDEVPIRFGQSSKTLSLKGEKLTRISYVEGWGDRLGTMVLACSADGYVLDVVLIYKGAENATRQDTKEERKQYDEDQKYCGVHVVFQPKAWIDTATEKFVLEKQVLPYLKKVKEEDEGRTVDLLLQHDNVAAHFAPECVELASKEGILELGSPPGLTNYIQLIDRNIGKAFRADFYQELDEEIERMEKGKMEKGELQEGQKIKLEAKERRKMVAEKVAVVLKKWRSDERKIEQVKVAALRTGLSISAIGACHGVTPQSFPEDFHRSLSDSSHPFHNVIKEFSFRRKGPPKAKKKTAPTRDNNNSSRVPPKEKEEEDVDSDEAESALDEEEHQDDGWDSAEEDVVYLDGELITDKEIEAFMAENEDEKKVISSSRGCLQECGCNKDRPNRCGCKNLKGCSAACACGGECALGLREEEPEEEEGVSFDTAVRLHDGEDIPKQILERDIDGYYFRTIWSAGDETWEPLQNFVDLQDCTYNPLIIPFLSEEEKLLLDNGELVFLEDEEEDKVQEQKEEKNSNMEKLLPKRSGSVAISINNSSNVHIRVNSSE
jgi:hypothetical protein